MSKFEEKTRISRGINSKKWKISKAKGSTSIFEQIDILNNYKYIFFLEKPNFGKIKYRQ